MPTVIDSLIVALELDPSNFTSGQKAAAASAVQTQKTLEQVSRETERNTMRAMAELERARQRDTRATEKAAKDRASAERKSAKEAADAHKAHGESIDAVARKLVGLFALFTAGASISQFVASITQGDAALGRLAQTLGLMPSAVSNLGNALERNGGAADSAAAAFGRLNDAKQAMLAGHADTDLFKTLAQLSNLGGVAIDAFAKPEEQLKQIGAAINAAGKVDPARAAYLGKQATNADFTNWALEHSKDEQAADTEQSGKLGGPSKESIAAAKELTRQFVAMKQASEDLGRQIFVGLAPAINDALKGVLSWVEANKEWLKASIEKTIRSMGEAIKAIPWKEIGESIKTIARDANAVAQAFGGWTHAIESLFAIWLGARFLAVLANVRMLMGALGVPIPPWLAKLGMLGVVGGAVVGGATEAYKAVTESDDDAAKNHRGLGPIDMLGRGARAVRRWFGGKSGNDAIRLRAEHGRGHLDASESATGSGRGGSAGAASRMSMMGYAMDQLRREGVPEQHLRAAAANLVGQADMESGLDPNKVHDNGTGYGIYGARLDRRSKMLEWLGANGYAKNSAEGQMREMAHRAMSERYSLTKRALMTGAYGEGVTNAITKEFENPAIINRRHGAVSRAYESNQSKRTTAGATKINFKGKSAGQEEWEKSGSPDQDVSNEKTEPAFNPNDHWLPYVKAFRDKRLIDLDPKLGPGEQVNLWNGISGAASRSNRLSRLAMASNISNRHSVDSSQRNVESHVGAIHVHTPATDGRSVASDLRRDLQKRGLIEQADYGLA